MPTVHNVDVHLSEERRGLLFVAAYCGLQNELHLQEGAKLQLVASDGQVYTSYTSVCRYLASVSKKSQQLLGSSGLDRAKVKASLHDMPCTRPQVPKGLTVALYGQVQDWLSFCNTELSGLSEQQLLKVCHVKCDVPLPAYSI